MRSTRSVTVSALQTSQAQKRRHGAAGVMTERQNAQQSVSGVNLDQEAANLVQYQQAYQAAAQVINGLQHLFNSLLTAVQTAKPMRISTAEISLAGRFRRSQTSRARCRHAECSCRPD